MRQPAAAVVTGFGLEAQEIDGPAGLLGLEPLPKQGAFAPETKLGRKGLLYKDDATKLALCSVQDALKHAGLPVRDLHDSASTGVVVSSNLGNIDTVCRIIDTLYAGNSKDLSPMDVPKASSNVIASSIAIRFGCRAVNLMLCNGATSGLDALLVAANALKSRRAQRMIVVGVEPTNEWVRKLAAASLKNDGETPQGLQLGQGAACAILETPEVARDRKASIYGLIGAYETFGWDHEAHGPSLPKSLRASAAPDFWLTPNLAWASMRTLSRQMRDIWDIDPPSRDLSQSLGDLYGALGVFQCVAACAWLHQQAGSGNGPSRLVLATAGGSWGDGVASLTISSPAQ